MIHIQKFNSAADCLEAQRGIINEAFVLTMNDFQKMLFQKLFYLSLAYKYEKDEGIEEAVQLHKDGGWSPNIFSDNLIILGDGVYYALDYIDDDGDYADDLSEGYAEELMTINNISWVFEQAFETAQDNDLKDHIEANRWLAENGLSLFSNNKTLGDKLLEIFLKK